MLWKLSSYCSTGDTCSVIQRDERRCSGNYVVTAPLVVPVLLLGMNVGAQEIK
jgi:hypothetical protein